MNLDSITAGNMKNITVKNNKERFTKELTEISAMIVKEAEKGNSHLLLTRNISSAIKIDLENKKFKIKREGRFNDVATIISWE